MSAENMFYYTRRVDAKDQEGKDVVVKVRDCFNLFLVVRGWWHNAEEFHIMLHDGHEESRNKEIQTTGGKKISVGRERDWYFTQVSLDREDAERFRKATEVKIEG